MIVIATLVVLIEAYLLFTIDLFNEIPTSISNTHYLYSQRYKHGYIVFPTFMVTLAFLILPLWISITEPMLQFTAFLAGSGLLFVGVAACYKERLTRAVHYTAAFAWGIGSVVWLIAQGMLIPLGVGVLFGALGIGIYGESKRTFFAEVACVVALILGLTFKITQ